MPRIFMFPGQSSRYPEMIERILDAWRPASEIVARASDILDRNLRSHYRQGEAAFERNRDVQVGVFLTSYLHCCALEATGITAEASLGLSLGEYNHLVHIGALGFEDTLRLVDARGRAYDQGPAGMMACIQPASVDEVQTLIDRARVHGQVCIANYNSPSQQVIAGDHPAVQAVLGLCEDELFVQPIVIEQSIPMHTPGFRPAADLLRPHLQRAPWRRPVRPYVPNVTARPLESAEAEDIIELLYQHVYSPVRWRESIDVLVDRYPDSEFIEVGPGGVLSNLLQKRWHTVRKYKSDSRSDLAQNLGSLQGELGAAP